VAEELSRDEQLSLMMKRLRGAGMNRRDVLKVAAAATGAAALGVATSAASSAAPGFRGNGVVREQGGEQVFYHDGMWQDPKSFDYNRDLYCNAEETTFEGLLRFDPDLAAIPGWAESFDTNDDASEFTFHIRPDNKGWSDGTPVTAGDFVFSFKRQLDPETAATYPFFLYDIKYAEWINGAKAYDAEGEESDPLFGKVPTVDDLPVEAVDDWTLKITMQGPRSFFPQVVAYTAAVPAPQHMVEKYGNDWATGENGVPIVSNGGWQVETWEKGKVITMVPNPGYWNAESIQLDRVINPVSPAANAVTLFENGSGDQQLDWTNLSAADYERFSADAEKAKLIKPYVYPGIWMMLPSNGLPPFDKPEVLKALTHAIDRDRLSTVTKGLVVPAYCMMPIGVFGFLDDPTLQDIQNFDPAAALDALKGTEFEGGKNWPEITMWMRANEEIYNADVMANDIVDQLKQNLGMDITISPVSQSVFSEQLYENQWQLVFIRWWSDYPDPNNSYGDMFYSAYGSRQGKRQAWSNKEFDDLVNQGKAEVDPAKRLEIYRQAEQIIQENVGYMPLAYRLDNYVFKPWVEGVAVNSQGYTVPDGNIYIGMLNLVSTATRPA